VAVESAVVMQKRQRVHSKPHDNFSATVADSGVGCGPELIAVFEAGHHSVDAAGFNVAENVALLGWSEVAEMKIVDHSCPLPSWLVG
jgi:hypothetical protein